MKFALPIILVFGIACATDASDRKGKHRGAEAWSSCANGLCQAAAVAETPAKPAETPKLDKPAPVATVDAGSCATGSCSTTSWGSTSSSRGLFGRRR